VFVLASLQATSQFFNKEQWDRNRHQVFFGFGASNFLGDLGGKDAIGTNDFQDLELSLTKFSAYAGWKYALRRNLHFRTDLTWGQVEGDDKLTEEIFRNNRNLSFRSHIFEFTGMIELEIPIKKEKGHIYRIKGAKGWKYKGSSFHIFGGLGGFYYNPRTLLDGQWVELRPLRTEGQGLPDGPDMYKRISLCLPIGVGLSTRISRQWSLAIEASYRFTFTDYIDDVSTVYYNPQELELYLGGAQGQVASYLSNPALGYANGGLSNRVTAPGMQRGDPSDNDGYMFVMLKASRLIKKQPKRIIFSTKKPRYKRNKSRKIVF
jgi:hypothetical protein